MLKFIFIFIIFSSFLVADERAIVHFAPLPTKKVTTNIKEFLPLSTYLEQKLPITIKYIYKRDYQDILDGFKDGSIDVAYLGPLPFISLLKEYPYAKPIISFKKANGSSKYRCVLSKFVDDTIKTEQPIKVALTQPLSTCGYLMSSMLLKRDFHLDLKKQKYHYTMSHTNALTQTLQGKFTIAGAKESIAKKFESVGMQIIAKSPLLPGFSIVVNTKTLSPMQIQKFQKTLLSIPKEIYSQFNGFGKYGTEETKIEDYDSLHIDFEIPKKGNFNEE